MPKVGTGCLKYDSVIIHTAINERIENLHQIY